MTNSEIEDRIAYESCEEFYVYDVDEEQLQEDEEFEAWLEGVA